ncbi:hypothetical protein BDN70DRAFT_884686 [Pholiota conissans]|uniref:Uncharacterized protein n=1 Tax=Pholiota conissans TaxID=109636 RepID=A0A9P5YSB4_9AGAR|nr:hypothetical protein BDN70DRAFT_884686 [Pholiota conissans]
MFRASSKVLVSAFALVTVVSAQDSILSTLSTTCVSALKGLLVAPEAQCLNAGAFLSIAASGNIDVPSIATKWLTGLCATGSCSTASLTTIVQNVTAGCAQDVKTAFNIDISDPSVILPYVEQYYPSVRQIACLKDDSANTLCVPQTLTNLQNIIGPLGTDDLNMDTILADAQKIAASDYKNLACTSCAKQAYSVAAKVFPDPSLLASVNGSITDTCGASFTDGQNVTTVSQTAVNGQFEVKTTSRAVAGFSPITTAGAILVAISSAFTLLV